MSEGTAAILQEMSSDYADYATVNMEAELKTVYETVEEMQLRLEEFTSIFTMLQAKGDKSITENVPRLLSLRPQVNNLCKRIDALDFFITKLNLDLATLETNMEIVESTCRPSEKKFPMLNPFTSIFKKSTEATTNATPQAIQETPQIFKMVDYFKSNS